MAIVPVPEQILRLRADPAELRLMRAFVRRWAGRCRLSAQETFDACLVATEAATNAILHAGPEAVITIRCRLSEGGMSISVSDHGGGDRVAPAVKGMLEAAGPDEVGGRGLFLIQELTRSYRLDRVDGGTTVSMRLGVEGAPGPQRAYQAV